MSLQSATQSVGADTGGNPSWVEAGRHEEGGAFPTGGRGTPCKGPRSPYLSRGPRLPTPLLPPAQDESFLSLLLCGLTLDLRKVVLILGSRRAAGTGPVGRPRGPGGRRRRPGSCHPSLCRRSPRPRPRRRAPLLQGVFLGRPLAQPLEPVLPAAAVSQLHCHPGRGGRGPG